MPDAAPTTTEAPPATTTEAAAPAADKRSFADAVADNYAALKEAGGTAETETITETKSAETAPDASKAAETTTETKIETKGIDFGVPDEAFDEPGTKKPDDADADLATKEYDAPDHIKKNAATYKNWNELRRSDEKKARQLDRLNGEVATLREQVKGVQTDEGLRARLTEVEAQLKDATTRASRTDLTNTPEFQQQFIQPRGRAIARAVEIAKKAGIDEKEFRTALTTRGDARQEALDELLPEIKSDTARLEMGGLIREINQIDGAIDGALANAETNLAQLREHQKAEQSRFLENHRKQVGEALKATQEHLAGQKVAFFRKIDGNEKWNEKVDGYYQEGYRIMTESDNPREFGAAVLMGMAYPDTYNALVSARSTIADLQKQLAQRKAAEPGFNGKATTTTEASPKSGLSFADAVTEGAMASGAFRR